jgi:N-acyl-D-aspartate/D-glutamate deacylase
MADGFTEAQVNAAINYCETLMKGETTSGEKDMNEQLEASLFKKADLFSAMRSGDSDDVMAVMDYLLENSEAADPEKSLKSAITEEFKQEYINLVSSGRTSEAQKLAKTLQGLGLYATDGKTNYYSDKKLAEWVEDWEKAQEED